MKYADKNGSYTKEFRISGMWKVMVIRIPSICQKRILNSPVMNFMM